MSNLMWIVTASASLWCIIIFLVCLGRHIFLG